MQNYKRLVDVLLFAIFLLVLKSNPINAQVKSEHLDYKPNSKVAKIIIKGIVKDINGNSLDDVDVFIKNKHHHTLTDSAGHFLLVIPKLEMHKLNLVFDKIHYKTQEKSIELNRNEPLYLNIELRSKSENIDNINIKSIAPIQSVRESPFNVSVLDAKSTYNSTMQLSDLLNRASGVKVRQSAGLGSAININLNGFTGQNVKIFMDGVPMQGFGNAFQLNNIPTGIADRIEIYKGVVPIEFGTDAMGGVINIVTNQSANSFLDASYSIGSFNTHKGNLSFGNTYKNGFSYMVNAFMNYSDNDYKVKLSKMEHISTSGSYFETDGPYWARRFHDRFRNQTEMLKVGFVKRKWADRFFLGLTAAHQDQQVQTGGAYMENFVYGARTTSSKSLLPSLEYDKRNFLIKKLHFRLTGNYNYSNNNTVDTAARHYNWYGDWIPSPTKGENGMVLNHFTNKSITSTANLAYQINDQNAISINNVAGYFKRNPAKNDVAIDSSLLTSSDTMPKHTFSNITGISYRYRYNKQWNFDIFLKHYELNATGPVDSTSGTHTYTKLARKKYSTNGYGIAATYLFKDWQFKASFERAYRLPNETELFGDGNITTANSSLQPENSYNYNVGATINEKINQANSIYANTNLYYRNTFNFIQAQPSATTGNVGYVNFGKIVTKGIDAELRWYHKDSWTIGANVTYMDMRNRERARDNQSLTVPSITYGDRVPNRPYFYGNIDATYYIHNIGGKGNTLSLNYYFNYVGLIYLTWPSVGDPSTKLKIPKQNSHDFSATYMMHNGKYNISLEVLNFTNQLLYDNFSMQKPTRSFNLKFRYYLKNRKQ